MPGVGLFDIAVPSESVVIAGVEHKMRGLPLRIIVDLLKDYPGIIGLLGGGGLNAEAIIAEGSQAAALIIAAGYGMADDEKARKAAADLPLDVQIDLIGGIVKATLGGGAGPFAEKIKKIYDAFKVMESEESERDRKLERMKQRLYRMQSPPDSNSSSPAAATEPPKYGT